MMQWLQSDTVQFMCNWSKWQRVQNDWHDVISLVQLKLNRTRRLRVTRKRHKVNWMHFLIFWMEFEFSRFCLAVNTPTSHIVELSQDWKQIVKTTTRLFYSQTDVKSISILLRVHCAVTESTWQRGKKNCKSRENWYRRVEWLVINERCTLFVICKCQLKSNHSVQRAAHSLAHCFIALSCVNISISSGFEFEFWSKMLADERKTEKKINVGARA